MNCASCRESILYTAAYLQVCVCEGKKMKAGGEKGRAVVKREFLHAKYLKKMRDYVVVFVVACNCYVLIEVERCLQPKRAICNHPGVEDVH